MKAKEYGKIEGVGNRWYSSNQLYASEHGLLITQVGISDESYRKIAFSDMCGFSITHSKRYMALNIIFGLFTLLWSIIFAAQGFDVPALGVLALVCAALLVVNLVKGRTCHCVVSTKYTHARLRSLTRMKAALEMKDYLKSKTGVFQSEVEEREPDRGAADAEEESLLV